jgi:transcriptional regulator with XRE-family HTH domain
MAAADHPDDHDGQPSRPVLPTPADALRDLGEFIRVQRENTKLSVRRLSEMAGVSNPYLSQIERGLRKPSADILQQIAKALAISAETLYVRAGILDEQPETPAVSSVPDAIAADALLTDEHKQALLGVYQSFTAQSAAKPTKGKRPTRGAS